MLQKVIYIVDGSTSNLDSLHVSLSIRDVLINP